MGMDVFGKNPVAESGCYFRASIWQWPWIHRQMEELCGDLVSKELMDAMETNDGAGPDSHEVCSEMADRFEQKLAREKSLGEMRANPDPLAREIYRESQLMLLEWIQFLRHCGGFSVW
jgi:hypothetical protein